MSFSYSFPQRLIGVLFTLTFIGSIEAQIDASSTHEPLPYAPASFGAAVVGRDIYLAGGHIGRKHVHTRDNQSASFGRLDVETGRFTALPGGAPLQGLQLVAFGGQVVRVGGMQAENGAGEPERLSSVASVAVFDVTVSKWTTLPDLPEPRSSHDAVVVGDKLVVVGGWTLTPSRSDWRHEVAILDLGHAASTWETVEAPFTRRALAAATLDAEVVVIGGIDDEEIVSGRVDVFHLPTRRWTRGPDFPGRPFGLAATRSGERVHVSGFDGTVYSWKPGETAWTPGPRLVVPRFFHRLLEVAPGRLLALGGASRYGHLASIETLAVDRKNDEPAILRIRVPFAAAARRGWAVAVRDGELRLFGGNKEPRTGKFEAKDFSNECLAVDLRTLRARRLGAMPHAAQSQILVADDRSGCKLLGGFGAQGDHIGTLGLSLEYDWIGDEWVESSSADYPSQSAALAVRGDVWLVGGHFEARASRIESATSNSARIRRINSKSTAAETVTLLPRERRAPAAALVGNALIVVGGMTAELRPVETVDVFEIDKSTWREATRPKAARVAADAVTLGPTLYLGGGIAPLGAPLIESYDVEQDRWRTLIAAIDPPLVDAHMTVWDDVLVLISTHACDAIDLLFVRP